MLIGELSDLEKKSEIMKDKDQIISFLSSVIQRQDYKRRVKKSLRFPFNYIARFKNKRGNIYFLYIVPTDKKRGSRNPLFNIYTYLETKEGVYVARYDIVRNHITLFTPHFFRRYRERFLKDDKLSTHEVIDTFCKRNPNYIGERDSSYSVCKDGAVFLKIVDDGLRIGVTFVSHDLQGKQQKAEWNGDFEALCELQDFLNSKDSYL